MKKVNNICLTAVSVKDELRVRCNRLRQLAAFMKKTDLILLCGALVCLSGCAAGMNQSQGSDNNSSSSASSTNSSTSSSSISNSSSGEGSSSGTLGAGNPVINNSSLDYPDNKAGRMVAAALRTDNWPQMEIVSGETLDTVFSDENGIIFGVDDLEEYCFATNIISAQLYRVVVVKPANGKEGAAADAVERYKKYAQNGAAFYPDQEESAAGAVSGKTSDGYIYLVVHKNGQIIADAMEAAE